MGSPKGALLMKSMDQLLEEKTQEVEQLKKDLEKAKQVLLLVAPAMAVLARSDMVAPMIRQELMAAEKVFLTLPKGFLA